MNDLHTARFLPLACALLVLALFAAVGEARAQTRALDVDDANGDSLVHVNDDGGFAAYSEEGTGTIPAEGAGARMMWHPAKAAFRAGEVGVLSPASEEWWDDANVGRRSVAFGQDTEASGVNSTATGDRATASGANSTAMGSQTTASGGISTAMGTDTEASGISSTAMGSDTEASGNYSTAMGNFTEAATESSLTIGTFNDANEGAADNTLFVAGNGTGVISRSDALVLDFDGNLTISGTLTESSDRRLKETIQPLGKGVLGKLGQIRPVRFRFKEGTGHPAEPQVGLIAQEVQAQFPELVSEGSSGYLSVSYSKFTAVLLKGLQQQQAEIERLRAKANRVDKFEQRLSALEQRQGVRAASLPVGGPWMLGGLLLALVGGVLVWRWHG